MEEEFLETVVVDICAKTFLLKSDCGDKKRVTCEDTDQFMRVLKVCTDKLDESQIQYADLSTKEA